MTVEQMCEFAVLAEQRNFLVAADLLFTTQATLSRHIMAMEDELGFHLFNRTTKRIELTPNGSRFLVHARQVKRLRDEYLAELAAIKDKQNGVLTVGYNFVSTLYYFTEHLIQFMSDHREVEFKIFEAEREKLQSSVRNGSCELAFFLENPFERPTDVDSIHLSVDTMVAILPRRHYLSKAEKIDLIQLKNEPFVASIVAQEPASVFVEACRRSGFEPNIIYPGVFATEMSKLIARESCVGLDWKRAAELHHADGVVIVPVEPALHTHFSVIYQRETLSDIGKQMISYLKKAWVKNNED